MMSLFCFICGCTPKLRQPPASILVMCRSYNRPFKRLELTRSSFLLPVLTPPRLSKRLGVQKQAAPRPVLGQIRARPRDIAVVGLLHLGPHRGLASVRSGHQSKAITARLLIDVHNGWTNSLTDFQYLKATNSAERNSGLHSDRSIRTVQGHWVSLRSRKAILAHRLE